MVRAPMQKVKKQTQSLRQKAGLLGVSHSHLSRVLRGERTSQVLLVRYRALKGTR
jgi:hypothetical protein